MIEDNKDATQVRGRRRKSQRRTSKRSSDEPDVPLRLGSIANVTADDYFAEPVLYTYTIKVRIDIAAGLDKQTRYRQHSYTSQERREGYKQDDNRAFLQYTNADSVLDVAEFWFKRRASNVAEDSQIYIEKYKIDTRFTTIECSY